MKELLLRTGTGILLIGVFVGSILLGPTPFLIMILVVYGLATRELFILKSTSINLPSLMFAVSGAMLIMGIYSILKLGMNPIWLLVPVFTGIAAYSLYGKNNPGPLVFFWLAAPLALFMALGWLPEGSWSALHPLSTIALVWVYDTFAYVWGRLLGKHPMTPKLSPRKTWEGFAGGMIFAMLAAWLIYHFSGLHSPAVWIAAGALTSLFALAGDLFESGLKRKYKVKDTGRILPGHGGILDRFDSVLFVAPALFLLLLLVHLFK